MKCSSARLRGRSGHVQASARIAFVPKTARRGPMGSISLISSNRLPLNSSEKLLTPLIFSPGWAKLATRPVRTGSETRTMTIGGGAGCVLDGKRNLGVDINDHVELEASQLLREFTEPF